MEFSFENQITNEPTTLVNRPFKNIHKKVVCRYWLNSNCSKHDSCEFIHEFVPDKMPECRKGTACKDPSCYFKHIQKDEKPLCANYEAGFCSFGHSCSFRHEYKAQPPPLIAQMFLTHDPAKELNHTRSTMQSSFRSAECPYFKVDGWCPYFLICAFSHGPPVKKFKKRRIENVEKNL